VQRNSGHDGALGRNIAIISEPEVNNFINGNTLHKLQRHDGTSGACVEQYVCGARLRQCTMFHVAPCVEGKFEVDPLRTMMYGKVDV